MIRDDSIMILMSGPIMNKVHEDMNSLVEYMIRGECNITIDTENFLN